MATTGSSSVTSPVRVGIDDKTYFYFTVFLLHNPPIFRSNRIKGSSVHTSPNARGEAGSFPGLAGATATARTSETGGTGTGHADVVGEFKQADASLLQEVPQQSLQQVAFPTAFGVSAKTARSLLYGPHVWESDDTLEGPPWRMELEEVRTEKGELQLYRLIVTSTFSTRVTSFKNATVSMQSRPAAVALVLCCPPSGTHYRFLIHHFGVVRTLLHSLFSFGMYIVQRFFTELLTLTCSGLCRQQDAFREVVSRLEGDAQGVGTYTYMRHVLRNALSVADTIPALHPLAYRRVYLPFTRWRAGPAAPQTVVLSSVSDMTYESLTALVRFSEAFSCAVLCGLLSVGEPGHSTLPFQKKDAHGAGSGRGGALASPQDPLESRSDPVEMDRYTDFWSQWEKAEDGGQQEGDASGEGGGRRSRRASPSPDPAACARGRDSPAPGAELPRAHTTTTWSEGRANEAPPCDRTPITSAPPFPAKNKSSVDDEGSYVPSGRQVSRVLIFHSDPIMAMHLLVVSAFMRRKKDESLSLPRQDATAPAELGRFRAAMYELAFAGQTNFCDYAGLAVQWVREEYQEDRLYELCSPFSLDNTLLIISPRQQLCRRVVLRKWIESTSVVLEHHGGEDVKRVSVAQPFRCDVWQSEVISADPLVSTLLRESLQLHRNSGGAIPCTATLSDMMRWVSWMGLANVMRGRTAAAQEQQRREASAARVPSSSPSYLAQHYHFPRTLPLPVVTDSASVERELLVSEAVLPGSAGSIDALLGGKGLLVSSQALAAAPSVSTSTSGGMVSVSEQSSVDSQLQRLMFGGANMSTAV